MVGQAEPNPPIGAIICGTCMEPMRILTAAMVKCPMCLLKWRLINGRWSLEGPKSGLKQAKL